MRADHAPRMQASAGVSSARSGSFSYPWNYRRRFLSIIQGFEDNPSWVRDLVAKVVFIPKAEGGGSVHWAAMHVPQVLEQVTASIM